MLLVAVIIVVVVAVVIIAVITIVIIDIVVVDNIIDITQSLPIMVVVSSLAMPTTFFVGERVRQFERIDC